MNNRIAKKILCCKSTLHTNETKVLKAREQVKHNEAYFKRKCIFLLPIGIDPVGTI